MTSMPSFPVTLLIMAELHFVYLFISVPTANLIALSTVGASTPVYMLHVTLANYNIC